MGHLGRCHPGMLPSFKNTATAKLNNLGALDAKRKMTSAPKPMTLNIFTWIIAHLSTDLTSDNLNSRKANSKKKKKNLVLGQSRYFLNKNFNVRY